MNLRNITLLKSTKAYYCQLTNSSWMKFYVEKEKSRKTTQNRTISSCSWHLSNFTNQHSYSVYNDVFLTVVFGSLLAEGNSDGTLNIKPPFPLMSISHSHSSPLLCFALQLNSHFTSYKWESKRGPSTNESWEEKSGASHPSGARW